MDPRSRHTFKLLVLGQVSLDYSSRDSVSSGNRGQHKKVCNRFRMFKEIAEEAIMVGANTGTRVRVDRCDIHAIPYFIPFVDLGGVTYPVRVILDDVEDEVESLLGNFQGEEEDPL